MNEGAPSEISEGWWEIVIVLFVIVSVFGAALLTQQDRPSLPADLSASPAARHTQAPRLATPTPTKEAGYGRDMGEPTSASVLGTPPMSERSHHDEPATPTPTLPVPLTVIGWTD